MQGYSYEENDPEELMQQHFDDEQTDDSQAFDGVQISNEVLALQQ